MALELIGRDREQRDLRQLIDDKSPQLIGVYGRRRVGKTFLVRAVFDQPDITFIEITGQKGKPLAQQLRNFSDALTTAFRLPVPVVIPTSWREAFSLLTTLLSEQPGKKVIFFDELPWLATKRSGMLQELDYFWNTKWSRLESLVVVLCGSAASWMLEKLINAKGGLHNRLTKIVPLKPFSLHTTEQFLTQRKIRLDRSQLLDLYFCTGGIPFYLSLLPTHSSAAKLVQQLAFEESGRLFTEFDVLLQSLFDDSEAHKVILSLLANKRYGLTRKELQSLSGLSGGGALSKPLDELSASGFIQRLVPFEGTTRNAYYQLTDEYTLFYHRWIAPLRSRAGVIPDGYWLHEFGSQAYSAWAGLTLEVVCMKHINEMLRALGISGMKVLPSTWRCVPSTAESETRKSSGAQIDIVLDRADRVINLCEIKYRRDPLKITTNLEKKLLEKQSIFLEQTRTNRTVRNILFCSGGFREGEREKLPSTAIDEILNLEALFSSTLR